MKVQTKLNLRCNKYQWKVTGNNHSNLHKFTGDIYICIILYICVCLQFCYKNNQNISGTPSGLYPAVTVTGQVVSLYTAVTSGLVHSPHTFISSSSFSTHHRTLKVNPNIQIATQRCLTVCTFGKHDHQKSFKATSKRCLGKNKRRGFEPQNQQSSTGWIFVILE